LSPQGQKTVTPSFPSLGKGLQSGDALVTRENGVKFILVPRHQSNAFEPAGRKMKRKAKCSWIFTSGGTSQRADEDRIPGSFCIVDEWPELMQTRSSTLGRAGNGKTIVSLPLANRNFSQILALSPGAVVEVPDAGAFGKITQNVSLNGGKITANNFQFGRIVQMALKYRF
jgi:hypothetical protein